MDLESESSVIESVEDNNELIVRSGSKLVDGSKDCVLENVGKSSADEVRPEGGQSKPAGSIGSSPKVKKGYGLKKWKRIPRRESSKERGNSVDNDRGKRVLPNATNDSRNRAGSADTKQRSEGSVSSTNAVVKSPGLASGGFGYGLGFGPINAVATDSENSEDRSSRSSTAASAPRWKSEIAALGGYLGDNNGVISSNRDHNVAAQMGQQGKSRTDSGKKPRGNQVKIEKENSHSSMESDSRSSNFVFLQGASSVTSKGRQSRRSANYDGENSDDEAQGSEQRFAEELQAGFRKNMAECEDVSQSYLPADLNWKRKGVNSENIGLSADQDPLLESITSLQSAHEALAQELLKFREIGKDDSDEVQDSIPNLTEQQQYGETRQTRRSSLDNERVNLKWNVNKLESKLADSSSVLEVKESKVIELEDNTARLEENRKISELEHKNSRDQNLELESLFKQKIEAEVGFLVLYSSLSSGVNKADEIKFLEEQKTLASEQAKIVNFSENIGTRARMLKRQVDELEMKKEIGEYVKLEKRMCKFASLFFIQLVLLFAALCFFVLQLVPEYTEDVPT
ncbi:hypothetical protein DCAR_0417245 [Daucus carota subsp. sativus]|uniref:WPP domain-containing protein n=1 Tax=Daucus carota subsp. sativus TaxID=79200 RepID=A0A162ABS1_DAUCS|nr:PREDICTED: WPP domain-interacting protein 2-like [Daucus carota subsp. sativus]XP_017248232.1 PREDICTED: WPP domain-interacting protein 2-like [Daucus carota subsp. sativus]XP_017248233.1 PREDICTED: WPP domain-interacting protein 2-like [Daucus carota subsp. sativus]WOG97904.1 hypothetical protein DCAR_0417245 [Daucus carota subsp. sativus]